MDVRSLEKYIEKAEEVICLFRQLSTFLSFFNDFSPNIQPYPLYAHTRGT
jgi:hypothetical protein